jgi:hypothetical protein
MLAVINRWMTPANVADSEQYEPDPEIQAHKNNIKGLRQATMDLRTHFEDYARAVLFQATAADVFSRNARELYSQHSQSAVVVDEDGHPIGGDGGGGDDDDDDDDDSDAAAAAALPSLTLGDDPLHTDMTGMQYSNKNVSRMISLVARSSTHLVHRTADFQDILELEVLLELDKWCNEAKNVQLQLQKLESVCVAREKCKDYLDRLMAEKAEAENHAVLTGKHVGVNVALIELERKRELAQLTGEEGDEAAAAVVDCSPRPPARRLRRPSARRWARSSA